MMMRINYYWWLIDYYFCLREKGRGRREEKERGEGRRGTKVGGKG